MGVTNLEQQNNSDKTRYTGCVKWFNNKSGYGFVTVISEGNLNEKDIFAHHSSIVAKGDLYKYLVQGEYVEFEIQHMNSKEHDHQAVNISGILLNDLMCETRHKNKDLSKVKDGFTQVRRSRRNIQSAS